MRKLLGVGACLLAIPFLVSCQCGIKKQADGHRAVFTLDNSRGTYKTKVERLKKGEGTIYFSATLSEGEINVYYDLGLLWDRELLFSASAGEPASGASGYIEYSDVTIIIESISPATGELIIDFEYEITQTE